MKKTLFAVLLLMLTACSSDTSPTAPGLDTNDPVVALWDGWGHCMGIHVPGGTPETVQIEIMTQLAAAGRINSVRLGANLAGHGRAYHDAANGLGLTVMGVIGSWDLDINSDWAMIFSQIQSIYPGVTVWNIANEISNAGVNSGSSIDVDTFWPKFLEIYNYTQDNHPNIHITNPPTFGSGTIGAEVLQEFFEKGMLDLDVDIAINLYSIATFSAYQRLFQNPKYANKLARKKIWIAETGIPDPARHADWVQTMYPKMGSVFGSEAICWYVLWGGNNNPEPNDNEFGLIDQINGQTGEYTTRPFLDRLLGR